MHLSERAAPLASAGTFRRTRDKQLLLVLLLAAAVLVVRSALIERAHSETCDAEYHLNRGIAFLSGTVGKRILNDPPLGEALSAFPMWITGSVPSPTARGLYGHRIPTEVILVIIAVWKAILFLPLVAAVFWFCRQLYGLAAAWLAVVIVLADPTFAAHIGLPTVDVLGVEGIVIACLLAWRYFQRPTVRSLNVACLAVAVAVLLKHTAALLPLIIVIYAVLWWHVRPWLARRAHDLPPQVPAWSDRFAAVARAAILIPLLIWVLTLFDFSQPTDYLFERPRIKSEFRLLRQTLPAGIYIGSFVEGMRHNADGHDNFLFGQSYHHALWYYFPAVATYKVPLGIAAVLLLGVFSLRVVRPRWDEWALVIPMVAYALWLMTARINIGFRHFLPPYIFMFMLASRCVASGTGRGWRIAAWIAVAAAALHAISFHPDYLSYLNFPRHKPYLAISDSNVDWGQSLKQVRAWVESFARSDERRVYIRYFGNDRESVRHYLDGLIPGRVRVLKPGSELPGHGVVIISPVWVAGVYDRQDRYSVLRRYEPTDAIGHSMLVYDLDKLNEGRRFRWRPPRRGAPAGPVYQE